MKKIVIRPVLALFILFLFPALLHVGVWAATERPSSWRSADWSSARILPDPAMSAEAAVYVMAARTGGLKGALAVHTWIVLKRKDASTYDRYEVVGWGMPVRHNSNPADGRWYSNEPWIVYQRHGARAQAMIPDIEQAIATYPWSGRGDYRIWPGPNSNTFVAAIVEAVPALDAPLPPTAVGKDFPARSQWFRYDAQRQSLRLSLGGYAGLRFGLKEGVEINFLGLVTGLDFTRPGIMLPGFGLIAFS